MQIKYLQRFLWIYFAVMSVYCIYLYGIVVKANGDNVEHLNAAWMIWQGNIPYRDFFQHHNPLLWYITALPVAYFINFAGIFSLFNSLCVLIICLIIYYQAKILKLNGTGKTAVLFLAGIMISSYSVMLATNYRPDTFMFLFFFIGLYSLFSYYEKNRLQKLVVSFLSFFISFMFTQKVLLILLVPAVDVLYRVLTHKIKIGDVLYACLLPVGLFFAFAGYLYYHDALLIYWKSNFLFNMHIPDIFAGHRIIFPPKEYLEFYIFLPLAGLASVYFFHKGTYIEKLFSAMFVLETIFKVFYFSAFLHYSVFWLILAVMLTVMFLDRPVKLKYISAVLGILYLLFMSWYNYQKTYQVGIKTHHLLNGHELAFKELTPCDYAINGYFSVINLKAKNPGYYAILLGQIDVLGEKTGIAPRDDLNNLIRKYKPKIVFGEIYWDTYWEERGKKVIAHRIDPYLINTYYDYSGIGSIFILKPQYQKHNCVYNGKTWEFVD